MPPLPSLVLLWLQFCLAAAAWGDTPPSCEPTEVRKFTRYDSALLREQWRSLRWELIYPRPGQAAADAELFPAVDADAVLAAPGAAGERLLRALDGHLCRPPPEGMALQWQAYLQRDTGGGGAVWLTLYGTQFIDGVAVSGGGCHANFDRRGELLGLRCNLLRPDRARLAPGDWPAEDAVREAAAKAYLSHLRNVAGPGQAVTSIERLYRGNAPIVLAHHAGCGTTTIDVRSGRTGFNACNWYDAGRPLHGAGGAGEALQVIDGLPPDFEPRQIAAAGDPAAGVPAAGAGGQVLVEGYSSEPWTDAKGVFHASGSRLLLVDEQGRIRWQREGLGGGWFYPRGDRILLWQRHEDGARPRVEARASWLDRASGKTLGGVLKIPLSMSANVLPDISGQRVYIVTKVAPGRHELRAVDVAGRELWRADLPRDIFVHGLGQVSEQGGSLLLSRDRGPRRELVLMGFGPDGGSRWEIGLPPDMEYAQVLAVRQGSAWLHSTDTDADTRASATLWQVDIASGQPRQRRYMPNVEAYRMLPGGEMLYMGSGGGWALLGGTGVGGVAAGSAGTGRPWRRHIGFGGHQSFTDAAVLPDGTLALVARVSVTQPTADTSGRFGIARLSLPMGDASSPAPDCPPVSEDALRTLELALWRDHHIYLSPELYEYQPKLPCIDANRGAYLDFLETLHRELTRIGYRAPGYFVSLEVEPGQPGLRFRGGGVGRGGHWDLQRSFHLRAQFGDARKLAHYLRNNLLPHARRVFAMRQQFSAWTGVPLTISYPRRGGPDRLPALERRLGGLVALAREHSPLAYPQFARLGVPGGLDLQFDRLALPERERHQQLPPLGLDQLTAAQLLERIQALYRGMQLRFEGTCNEPLPAGADATWRLQYALVCNDLEKMQSALAAGANPNAANGGEARTPLLHGAAIAGSRAWELLLNAGAEPLARDIYGNTALHAVAAQGARTVLAKLAGEARLVNAEAYDGATALHRAVFAPGYPAVLLAPLVAGQRDIDARTVDGDSALHLAAHSPELVTLLLEAGADPNARNARGQTPLHRAAGTWLAADSLRGLLAAGADPALRDHAGLTPLEFAVGERLPANAAVLRGEREQ